MVKIHILSNYKRSRSKKNIQSATLFVALLISISSFAIGAETTLQKDLTRFIFKYYNLLTISDFKSTLKKEISFYYPKFNIDEIDGYFQNNKAIKPGDLVRFLEKLIDKSNNILLGQSKDLREMTSDEWVQYVKQAELYIIYASENGHKSESSVGHLAFLYDFEDLLFFDNIVTYFAIDFLEIETGKPTINSYLEGAFGELHGSFINYPFHDALHEYLLLEDRIVSKYKLNLDEIKREEIDNAIWQVNQSTPKYNFFNNNCATELMRVLGDVFSINERYLFSNGYIIRTPAELVRSLKSKGIVTYEGAYRYILKEDNKVEIIFDKDSKYDTAMKSYTQQYSISSSKAGNTFGFTFFQSSRPYNGLSKRKSSIVLLDFTLLVNQADELDIIFNPIKFKYYLPIVNNIGIKIDLNNLDDKWDYPTVSGLYLDLGDIRTEINYQYIIYNSENIYNLQMHYSNSSLDVMFGKNNFDGNDNLFCGIELFLTNNLSINLSSDFSANNFGISYYR